MDTTELTNANKPAFQIQICQLDALKSTLTALDLVDTTQLTDANRHAFTRPQIAWLPAKPTADQMQRELLDQTKPKRRLFTTNVLINVRVLPQFVPSNTLIAQDMVVMIQMINADKLAWRRRLHSTRTHVRLDARMISKPWNSELMMIKLNILSFVLINALPQLNNQLLLPDQPLRLFPINLQLMLRWNKLNPLPKSMILNAQEIMSTVTSMEAMTQKMSVSRLA